MSVTTATHRKGLAFTVAFAVLLTLVLPFAGLALASHTSGPTTADHDIEVTDETDTNATGDDHTLTADETTATCTAGDPCEVDFEVESGPDVTVLDEDPGTGAGTIPRTESGTDADTGADPDMSCTIITAGGTCTVSFESTTAGTNIIRAWVDDDFNDSNVSSDRDNTEGRDEATTPGQVTEADDTDVVSKTWFTTITNATLNCTPETATNPNTGTDSTETYTCTAWTETANLGVQDAGEAGISGIAIDGENLAGVNDADDNAVGSATNSADYGCTTDTTGACTLTVAASEAQAGTANICFWIDADGDSIFFTGAGGVFPDGEGCGEAVASEADGNETDKVTKTWAPVGVAANLDLAPADDQNLVNTSHTVTATVTDFAGSPVAGVNVDFDIAGGSRNVGTGVEGADRLTNAAGQATFTYADSNAAITGAFATDTINAWADIATEDDVDAGTTEPSDSSSKFWFTTLPTTDDVIGDLTATGGAAGTGGGADCNDTDVTADKTATNLTVPDGHRVCAQVLNASDVAVPGQPVTFTITGPGAFFTDTDNDEVLDTTETLGGKTVTVNTDVNGEAFAPIYSDESGAASIALTSGAATDTVTKNFEAELATERNIACTPETGSNEPGTDHVVLCTVTDRFGNPVGFDAAVAGTNAATVTGTETGPGRISSTLAPTTNQQGQVEFILSTTVSELGAQTFTATITSNRGAGTADDPCEAAVGTTVAPETGAPTTGETVDAAAGNCADTVSKDWESQPITECNDGVDNDGDGDIDFPADSGCDSATDDDEGFVPAPCQNRAATENVIIGTSGADILNGTSGRDIICGAGGDDVISGRDGNDLIVGNGGDDTIGGGGGKDNASGNGGNDTVTGNKGNDSVKGNSGNDALKGNAGIDNISGGGGADSLQGGDGQDILKGGDGNDTLRGGDGADALDGGAGNDQCFGNAGDDSVRNCE